MVEDGVAVGHQGGHVGYAGAAQEVNALSRSAIGISATPLYIESTLL